MNELLKGRITPTIARWTESSSHFIITDFFYARIILWAGFCWQLMETKNVWLRRARDVVCVRCLEFGGSVSRGLLI